MKNLWDFKQEKDVKGEHKGSDIQSLSEGCDKFIQNGKVYLRGSDGKMHFSPVETEAKHQLDVEYAKKRQERTKARQEEKAALIWAGRTRLLTVEEMEAVRQWGIGLFAPSEYGYDDRDATLDRKLNELLLQQFAFRIMLEKGVNGTTTESRS